MWAALVLAACLALYGSMELVCWLDDKRNRFPSTEEHAETMRALDPHYRGRV